MSDQEGKDAELAAPIERQILSVVMRGGALYTLRDIAAGMPEGAGREEAFLAKTLQALHAMRRLACDMAPPAFCLGLLTEFALRCAWLTFRLCRGTTVSPGAAILLITERRVTGSQMAPLAVDLACKLPGYDDVLSLVRSWTARFRDQGEHSCDGEGLVDIRYAP